MTTEKITVTRGLVQLKLLQKRIRKEIHNGCFIDLRIGDKRKNEGCTPKENFQSTVDLISRRNRIKSAIMKSNSVTEVKIAGETMTVAEAIERKNSIYFYKELLDTLRRQYKDIKDEVERINDEALSRLDNVLESMYSSHDKLKEDYVQGVKDEFFKSNGAEIVDELKIEEKIEGLGNWIDEFLSEVDLVLSESNTKTMIEI